MALQTRPPVITIMGHVDHGKTTLLDYLRHSRVQEKEAGGITQHIGAYQVEHAGQKLTFIDTPGHAAFNKMRQRGAQITDIVILVVAANDGVKPQTIESIRYIKESNVSVLVAINKIDLEAAQPAVAKSELAEHEIVVTDFGGDVEAVEISAKTGQGVDKLLETLTLMSELLELKADPAAPLEAVVIESSLDQFRGPVASVIVQQGTLAVKQELSSVLGDVTGRVRALTDDQGQNIDQVTPGSPAEIQGLTSLPDVGSIIRDATADYQVKAAEDETDAGETANAAQDTPAVDQFADWDIAGAFEEKQKLKLIIKADVQGTLEAILQNFDEESVEIVSSGVGMVTEGDVETAEATGARIIAFHSKVPGKVKTLAARQNIKIKEYKIIYKLIEDLQKQMLKLMEPRIDEVETGVAEILQIFEMKGHRVAGSRVVTGEIKKQDQIHIMRGEEIIASPQIASLQKGKDEVDRVTAKSEFGMTFRGKKVDFQVGDKIIAYYEEED